tara:strand:- start:512 stop:643 length:132 start_codon:yes stop_codon:yes gene_type:complete
MVIDWQTLYLDLLKENKLLKAEIEILNTILHTYLPVITGEQEE